MTREEAYQEKMATLRRAYDLIELTRRTGLSPEEAEAAYDRAGRNLLRAQLSVGRTSKFGNMGEERRPGPVDPERGR